MNNINFKGDEMNQEVVILVAEDDDGHAGLIKKNLFWCFIYSLARHPNA